MNSNPARFRQALVGALARWNIELSDTARGQMEAHFHALIESNRNVNLTRITDPAEAAVKHYADCLALLLWVRDRAVNPSTIIDIGTGAGFPAVPIAIIRPDWKITAMDGTVKKISFVKEVCDSLGLDNLETVHTHSTQWNAEQTVDLVMVRAVGRLSKCIEQTARFVKNGGYLVAFKTPLGDDHDELIEAKSACTNFGLVLTPAFPYDLLLGEETITRALYALHRPGGLRGSNAK